MNKTGLTPTQLIIRIVIIIIVVAILLLVSFSMIKLVPKVFTSITDIRNLITRTATSTPSTTSTSTYQVQSTSSSTPVTQTTQNSNLKVDFTHSQINNGKGLLTFNVTNTTKTNSGPWKFSATLPRSGNTSYNSPYQTNIPPGKTSVMNLNFDNAQKGTIAVTINGQNFTSQIN